jgi:hypothetical protein
MIEEINEHLNGTLPWHEMSMEAQYAIEMWETEAVQEMSIHNGYLGYPGQDDDDIALNDEDM